MKLRRINIFALIIIILSLIAAITGVIMGTTTAHKIEYGLFYTCLALIWLFILYLELKEDEQPKRGFEVVKESCRKTKGDVNLPIRGTTGAMACDFYANDDYTVKPGEIAKVWTDVKAFMQEDEGLILNVRSSMAGKFMMGNTQGWVDRDYFSNPSNDGNIGFFLMNISNEVQEIKRGDRIGQGMFIHSLPISDNKVLTKKRKGGFGSTGVN